MHMDILEYLLGHACLVKFSTFIQKKFKRCLISTISTIQNEKRRTLASCIGPIVVPSLGGIDQHHPLYYYKRFIKGWILWFYAFSLPMFADM